MNLLAKIAAAAILLGGRASLCLELDSGFQAAGAVLNIPGIPRMRLQARRDADAPRYLNVTFSYHLEANLQGKTLQETWEDFKDEVDSDLNDLVESEGSTADVTILGLTSEEVGDCTPTIATNTACSQIRTSIELVFTMDSEEPILKTAVLQRIEEYIAIFNSKQPNNEVFVIYIGPLLLADDFVFVLDGVPLGQKMNDLQIDIFEDAVFEFLYEALLEEGITLETFDVVFQVLASDKNRRLLRRSLNDAEETNEVTTRVTASYTPPPERESLNEPVSDAVNGDSGEQLGRELRDTNEPYFSKLEDVSVNVPVVTPDSGTPPPLNIPGESDSGAPGWVFITFGASCVLFVAGALYIFARLRTKRVANEEEDYAKGYDGNEVAPEAEMETVEEEENAPAGAPELADDSDKEEDGEGEMYDVTLAT